jgi:hypothetical protein
VRMRVRMRVRMNLTRKAAGTRATSTAMTTTIRSWHENPPLSKNLSAQLSPKEPPEPQTSLGDPDEWRRQRIKKAPDRYSPNLCNVDHHCHSRFIFHDLRVCPKFGYFECKHPTYVTGMTNLWLRPVCPYVGLLWLRWSAAHSSFAVHVLLPTEP